MTHDRAMKLAQKMSYHSQHRVRIGAIVLKGKSIVGTGFNKVHKTHPLITGRTAYKHIHAETAACIGIDRHLLDGGTMYVYRELRDGSVGLSRPCCDCEALMRELGIKSVRYTDPSAKDGIGVMLLKETK